MTNQEILEKAIKKAIDGGWNWIWGSFLDIDSFKFTIDEDVFWGFYNNNESYWAEDPYGHISEIIFNHDFAKALWGEYPTYTHDGFKRYYEGQNVTSWLGCEAKEAIKDDKFATGSLLYVNWQYHLHFMVIADDPIKYLEENI